VGLAKPKPGVFIEAIQYLLVLTTPVEVMHQSLRVALGPIGAAFVIYSDRCWQASASGLELPGCESLKKGLHFL
jgi:hypothetical protein